MASGPGVEGALRRVLTAVQKANVPYMLAGSFASAFHGAPRVTHDIDIVIAPTLGSLNALLREFPDDRYYASRDAALEAYGAESMFNIVDFESGWKVDFIIRKSRAFSVEEFARRREADFFGSVVFVASAEDVILSKLEWAKLGESDRQVQDVVDILRTRAGELDMAYVARWVAELGVQAQWSRATSLAAPAR